MDADVSDVSDVSDVRNAADMSQPLRPATVCGELLAALEASEGRRRRRARDTTPDAIGLRLKRTLLEEIVRADPAPDDFEGWLLERCLAEGPADGPVRAMAMSIWDEWRLVGSVEDFRRWLAAGAPSDDRDATRCDLARDAGSARRGAQEA